MADWFANGVTAIDFETSGVNPLTARPVTCAIIEIDPDNGAYATTEHGWIIDAGVDIPAEAAEIHGYTTERVRDEGQPVADVIGEILLAVGAVPPRPIIAYNARYDLTLLATEAGRHGHVAPEFHPVIDPLILDKAIDPYRKGRRTLTAASEHYHVDLSDAHEATADALAAARLAWRLNQIPQLFDLTLDELHNKQIKWAKEQADSLREYFDRNNKPHDGVPGDWPVIGGTT